MADREIISKLDAFIRKYYLNRLVRGVLLGTGLLLAIFLLFSLGEYFGHFPTSVRAILFWSFVAALAIVMWFWIITPLARMNKLGPVISYEEAARIIGRHFGEVEDKLLNLLQLDEMAAKHPESALLAAGIAQKTKELKPVPFAGAVNIRANRRYLRFALIPLAALLVILVFQSHILSDGTERLFKYNRHFPKKAPFEFILLNKSLAAERGSNVKIGLGISGRAVPEDVYLVVGGQRIKMSADGAAKFQHELTNLQRSLSFHFEAAGFSSENHQIFLLPAPAVTDAEILLEYPAYTGRKAEKVNNTSELSLPQGTTVTWVLRVRDADKAVVEGGQRNEIAAGSDGVLRYTRRFNQTASLRLTLFSGKVAGRDTLNYSISVSPDLAPAISAEKFDDSANLKQFWFAGQASDDYGIGKLLLKYRFVSAADPGKVNRGWVSLSLPFSGRETDFTTGLNMDAIGMAAGDEVEYLFEVWDNDAVQGPKVSRTQPSKLRRQSLEEVRKDADATGNRMQNMMQQAFKEHSQMQKEAENLRNSLNSRKNMSWEDKQRVEDLVRKQQTLDEKLEQLKKENEKLQKQQNEFMEPGQEEKKSQMQELMKEMKNPELEKLMQEIQKLLEQKASKEEISEKLQQMQQQNKEQARDMKQLMEQFKELQLEQKLNDNIDRLNKLAEAQEKLAEQTAKQKGDKTGELKQQQEKLNKELEGIRKDLQEAEKMNSELEKPMKLELGEEEQQQAGQEQQQAGEQLDKGKNGKASENQKNAAEQMKKAAEKMQKSLEQEQQKRLGEDYQRIRELLENLVEASFEQEYVFTELAKIREFNPRFVELNKKQMVVREKCAVIEDSLRMLARRQPMVSTFITREISKINSNMDEALESLRVRRLSEAGMREQYVMTGLNNLAVMLLESMQQMQQKMSQQNKSKGNQSCSNPGGKGQGKGKPKNSGKLSQGQEQLGQMLQEMQRKGQQNKQGQSGEPKPGEQGDKREMNREYARMALMQEALRRQLAELRKALEQQGQGQAAKELQKTEQIMEQQEKDLVNKKWSSDMIRRQKEIETRLLEHEKAERTQQTEEKRESAAPEVYTPSAPPVLQEYIREKKRERELLQKMPPELTPYYQEKVRFYLQRIK